jgi:flavin reductase (NADH)/flavin reductase
MNPEVNKFLDWLPNPRLQDLPTVGAQDHRGGMRSVAAAVSIITACHEQHRAGLTATAVVSVTADPPRLAVFVNKSVVAADIILKSGALCVNVLASCQEEVAKASAGMIEGVHGDARFGHGKWKSMVTASPMLEDALVNFDCRVVKVLDESTHHVFVCDVLATQVCAAEEALVYLNGAFKPVPH